MSSSTTNTETTTTRAQPQPVQLTFPKAVNILIQGVNHAQSKGIYTLADANLLHQSIALVNKVMVQSFGSQQQQQQAQPQETNNDDDIPSNPEDKQKA